MNKLQAQAINNDLLNYDTLVYSYGVKNIKQLGNKIIVVNHTYGLVYGYDIATYEGFKPKTLCNKVFTIINNINTRTGSLYDSIYDYFYGSPLYNA